MPVPPLSHRHPSESISGPSSSSTRFPIWPSSHEEAEYWEIPPEHFLAQQAGQSQDEKIQFLERQRLEERRRSSIQFQRQRVSSPTSSSSSSNSDGEGSYVTAFSPSSPQYHPNPLDALANNLPDVVGLTSISNQPANPSALPDTTTLAAADFDVDVRSGFLPPEQPIQRLGSQLKEVKWEEMLEEARALPLRIGGGGKSCREDQRRLNRRWRRNVREVSRSKKLVQSVIDGWIRKERHRQTVRVGGYGVKVLSNPSEPFFHLSLFSFRWTSFTLQLFFKMKSSTLGELI